MDIKKHWYKIIGVLLFLYVIIAGLLVPLKPGLEELQPFVLTTGTPTKLTIKGYNSNYKPESEPEVWLKLENDKGVRAKVLSVNSHNQIEAEINIPYVGDQPYKATLFVHNDLDGTSIMPGVQILPPSVTSVNAQASTLTDLPYDKFNTKEGWQYPYRSVLHETIRYTFFHIAVWMAMFVLMLIALYHSIKMLRTQNLMHDTKAAAFTSVSVLYGLIGIATGSLWAKFTWGDFWTADVKLNMTTVALLIYMAYGILRATIQDKDQRARVSAAYNIFAFVVLIPLIFVIPRMTDSLHPGNGGNPALGGEDLDSSLRMVFYPAILALTLIGIWIGNLKYRFASLYEESLLK